MGMGSYRYIYVGNLGNVGNVGKRESGKRGSEKWESGKAGSGKWESGKEGRQAGSKARRV